MIRRNDFPGAVEFAAARQQSDFLRNHEFPGKYDALALLEYTTSETPAWLKQEWKGAAMEDLKNWLSLREYRDKEKLDELIRRHPDIWAEMQKRAEELGPRRNRLDSNERAWLGMYEDITGTKPEKQK